jgi:hypothetical protein
MGNGPQVVAEDVVKLPTAAALFHVNRRGRVSFGFRFSKNMLVILRNSIPLFYTAYCSKKPLQTGSNFPLVVQTRGKRGRIPGLQLFQKKIYQKN